METRFLGSRKSKLWTYLILGLLLVVGILVVNFGMDNPELTRRGVDSFMGLPSWAFPSIAAAMGALFFWVGLRLETDWPELIGAGLLSGSVLWAEVMIGWEKFKLADVGMIPWVLPPATFLVLMAIAMVKSR